MKVSWVVISSKTSFVNLADMSFTPTDVFGLKLLITVSTFLRFVGLNSSCSSTEKVGCAYFAPEIPNYCSQQFFCELWLSVYWSGWLRRWVFRAQLHLFLKDYVYGKKFFPFPVIYTKWSLELLSTSSVFATVFSSVTFESILHFLFLIE